MTSQDQITELVKTALEMRDRAYCPYSKFRVGAALLGKSGRVYTGCNVENASYGATVCAERTAYVKAISEGEREFTDLAIACDTVTYCTPCGICRQFISEFGLKQQIHGANKLGKYETRSADALLPAAFDIGAE
ncbi:cytidine deaminase [Syncephalis fuscata]|nr:cytidine deaminase [Syncephalis fuscata]